MEALFEEIGQFLKDVHMRPIYLEGTVTPDCYALSNHLVWLWANGNIHLQVRAVEALQDRGLSLRRAEESVERLKKITRPPSTDIIDECIYGEF